MLWEIVVVSTDDTGGLLCRHRRGLGVTEATRLQTGDFQAGVAIGIWTCNNGISRHPVIGVSLSLLCWEQRQHGG